MSNKIVVREMVESDCTVIADAFTAQGWNKPVSQYIHYWQDTIENKRIVLIAALDDEFAGYVTIVWESDYPPFCDADIPEISDFNVLIKYRRYYIGTALMDEAERRIAAHSPIAGLGVCLHVDYGAAQVLYAKRGYVPDGLGIYWQGHHPGYGEQVQINDDLCLYLTKKVT
jgi:ribosomal protein S18 acetylase RimI-like enzyme